MLDILAYLPAKKKTTPSGWLSFNAICCQHTGGSQDRRGRGGLKATEQGWSYHCFNCSYTASFILGRSVSYKARKLLGWMNVPEVEIEMLNLESLRHRSIHGIIQDRQQLWNTLSGVSFEERDLPPFAELLTPEHESYWEYVRGKQEVLIYHHRLHHRTVTSQLFLKECLPAFGDHYLASSRQ